MYDSLDLARESELYDTIPKAYIDIAVTTGSVTFDLNRLETSSGSGVYVSLGGKRVRFLAITQTVTFMANAATLTAGAGVTLAAAAVSQRYYIKPATVQSNPPAPAAAVVALPFTVISTGAATLRVFYGD